MIQGYDLVGDILSHDDTLPRILEIAGYERRNANFHHPSRKAIALGDFTERGPGQHAFINTVKDMVDQRDYPAVVEERRFLLRCELDGAYFHLYLPAERNGDWRLAKVGRLELAAIGTLESLARQTPQEVNPLIT